jgi:hypothetical protein
VHAAAEGALAVAAAAKLEEARPIPVLRRDQVDWRAGSFKDLLIELHEEDREPSTTGVSHGSRTP